MESHAVKFERIDSPGTAQATGREAKEDWDCKSTPLVGSGWHALVRYKFVDFLQFSSGKMPSGMASATFSDTEAAKALIEIIGESRWEAVALARAM